MSILLIVFWALLAIQMYEKSGSSPPPPMPPPQPGAPKSGCLPRSDFGMPPSSSVVGTVETPTVVSPWLLLAPPSVPLEVTAAVALPSVGVVSLDVAGVVTVTLALPVPLAESARPPLSPQPIATVAKIKLLSSLRMGALPSTLRGYPWSSGTLPLISMCVHGVTRPSRTRGAPPRLRVGTGDPTSGTDAPSPGSNLRNRGSRRSAIVGIAARPSVRTMLSLNIMYIAPTPPTDRAAAR